MNLYVAVRSYFTKMLEIPNQGMKVMILDEETIGIMSVAVAFSEIMDREVFLVERINSIREPLNDLIGVFFLRPSVENIALLTKELQTPLYSSYYLFFSHTLSKHLLKQLAEADEHEVVAEVREFFADYFALSSHVFCIERPLYLTLNGDVKPEVLSRSCHAITAALLSLHRYPQIRYQNSSESCKILAESVRSFISREANLFDFRKTGSFPVVLILDRRLDPITPLLTQWTYEAMIHELIGIKNNRVKLKSVGAEPAQELNLFSEFDDFFRTNQYMNFGEIGQSIKKLVANFQGVTKTVSAENVDSLADLKKLLENYPTFRKASGAVEMHVAIVSELSRIVKQRNLMEMSEIEQEMICQDNHSDIFGRIKSLLTGDGLNNFDAVRMVLLYALRWETHKNEQLTLSSILINRGVPKDEIILIDKIVQSTKNQKKISVSDLFSTVKQPALLTGSTASVSNATNTVASFTKRFVKSRKGIENVYTQHEPILIHILKELLKGQLNESLFPTLVFSERSSNSPISSAVKEVVVFIIGGATYEESFAIQKLTASLSGKQIIIGSTCMHNSESFINEFRMGESSSNKELQPITNSKLSLGNFSLHKSFKSSKSPQYSLLQ